MEALLISEDADLCALCAQVITETTREHPWSFSNTSAGTASRHPADLYILDFEPAANLPAGLDLNSSNVVALVHRRDVDEIKRILGPASNIILKPVSRSTLSALLSFAIANRTALELRADRDHIFQRLLETNLKLQESDQSRNEFVARLAHDLRAPLTAFSGYCGLLLGEHLGPLSDRQKDVVRRMDYSAQRLAGMAESLLNLNVGNRAKRRPLLSKGDLRATLDQALHEIGPLTQNKRITIKSAVTPHEGQYFESAQINQVLVNLLDNACRFTPRNGVIEIRGYPFFWERRGSGTSALLPKERRVSDNREPNCYRLDILNSGSALPRERLESIFEEYTSYAEPKNGSGGGLGLAICRTIIEDHGGRVWADNEESGPKLSFVLPTRRSSDSNSASAA